MNRVYLVVLLINRSFKGLRQIEAYFPANIWSTARNHQLSENEIDLVVLAGFMWLVPTYLVSAYQGKMVNIHPALLPKYGGKGMYGMNVHRAVKVAGEKESGITIHYVNAKYDEGNIIFQAACSLEETDSPEIIAQKVRTLEHQHFAPIIESLIIRH